MLTPRKRQKEWIDNTINALLKYGNTLSVASVAFGKTICIGEIIKELHQRGYNRILCGCNYSKVHKQNYIDAMAQCPDIDSGLYDGTHKDLTNDVTFFMRDSLGNKKGLEALENQLKLKPIQVLIVDEAHFFRSPSYEKIYDLCKKYNQNLLLFLTTATTKRSDKKGYMPYVNNVADIFSLPDAVRAGYLAMPKTKKIDSGIDKELLKCRKKNGEFDDDACAALMDRSDLISKIVDVWEVEAKNRSTFVFASSIDHSKHFVEEYQKRGYSFYHVDGATPKKEREELEKAHKHGEVQGLSSVGLYIAGTNHPAASCAVYARNESHPTVFQQAYGRVLRTYNEEDYPWAGVKENGLLIDCGVTSTILGTLESEVAINETPYKGETPQKECPNCGTLQPIQSRECPACLYTFPARNNDIMRKAAGQLVVTEIDLLNASMFRWEEVSPNHDAYMCAGFNAWGGIFYNGTKWIAIVSRGDSKPFKLAEGERVEALNAADSFVTDNELSSASSKMKTWLERHPTQQQRDALNHFGDLKVFHKTGNWGWLVDEKKYGKSDTVLFDGKEINRYSAALLLKLNWNKQRIKELLV